MKASGNPCALEKEYRKSLVLHLPNLELLDNIPVQQVERVYYMSGIKKFDIETHLK